MAAESAAVEFQSLASDLVSDSAQTSKRVLIVTQDILGPVSNGGIGTAYYYLACDLASQGHRVSILFALGRYSADADIDHWVRWYAQHDIELIPCPDPDVGPVTSLMGEACALPYRVYEYLKAQAGRFDTVHASEWGANLYFCLQAKRLGLAFQSLHFVIKASSPLLWSKLGNRQPLASLADLPRIYMERRCIEMADTVISGSRYMLGWMRDNGYSVAADRCFVQPNVFPLIDARAGATESPVEVRELVFFGRLEPRKGLAVYLDALRLLRERLGGQAFARLRFTFLGKKRRDFDAGKAISEGFSALDTAPRLLDRYGQPEALAYLDAASGALAVMPSLIDNSPFGVYELLAKRVPFVTSDRGGGKELIDRADWDRVIFAPDPTAICDCLQRIIESGCRTVAPAFDFARSLDTWRAWHLQPAPARALPPAADNRPGAMVSICLVTCNRPAELAQAIASISQLDYPAFELILVDDASDLPPAKQYLDELEATEFDFPFRLVRQSKQYLGAGRNRAAREAVGKYLLFMDDDNLAAKNELDCLVAAAEYANADIVTCFSDLFLDDAPDQRGDNNRILFAGADLASGLYCNPYGDSNCLVLKSAFDALGGFSEEFKVGRDDQEFFSRALLRGLRLELLPESLYWYRVGKKRMRQQHYSRFGGFQQVADTYISELGLGPELANALRYAQSVAADEIGIGQLLARRLLRINGLRRAVYRFPRILRLLRPLVRRLV